MGQLATEEFANLKAEYNFLEKEVRMNMIERERTINEIKKKIEDVKEECLGFVRTDVSL